MAVLNKVSVVRKTNAREAMSDIALLLSDVDGTLVTRDKVLTPRARQAVKSLHERNIRFAITSGRPPRGMAMFVDPLGLLEPIAGFNGGAYVAPDLAVLENHVLSPDAAEQALSLIAAHGLDAWFYTADTWYIQNPDRPHVAQETRTVAFPAKIVTSYEPFASSAVKIVGISDDLDRMARADDEIRGALGALASVARSQPYYLDITNAQANKGAVLRYHASRLGIPASRIATIGDMPNDVLMFQASGFSIAMGNASPEVQAQANAVTDSYENEGFAKAVERYLLNGEPEASPGS
jgi:hypothetical protein